MNKFFIPPAFDEFNYILSPVYEKRYLEPGMYHTSTHKNFEVLFESFDKIFVSDRSYNENIIDHFHKFPEKRIEFINHLNNVPKELQVIPREKINAEVYRGIHVYNFLFSNIAKSFLDNSIEYINPRKEDFLKVKEKFSHIDKKIVCISGRNMEKLSFNNRIYYDLIKKLISENIFVIGATINPPKFDFPKDSYYEIESGEITYSENISYFLNADCTIAVAGAAGITTHMMTKANFLLLGICRSENNPECGFEGKTIYAARKKHREFKTHNIQDENDYNQILGFLESTKKPIVDRFFDDTKTIKI